MGKKVNANSKIIKKEIVDLKSVILEKNDRVIYTHIIFYMRNAYSYIASWANLPVKREYIEIWQEKNPKNKFPVKTDSDICFQARCIIDEIYSKYMIGFSFPTQKQLIIQTAIFFLERIATLQEFPEYSITEQTNWFINNTAGPILANRKFSFDKGDITESIATSLVKKASSGFCRYFIQNISKEINTVCDTVGSNCARGINPLRSIDLKHFQKFVFNLYSDLGIPENDCKLDFDVFKQCMRPFIRDIKSSKWTPTNNALFCAFFDIIE